MVSRFRLPVWIAAVSQEAASCHGLQFSYGVSPVHTPENPADWSTFARGWVQREELAEGLVVLMEISFRNQLQTNLRLEIINLGLGGFGHGTPVKDKT